MDIRFQINKKGDTVVDFLGIRSDVHTIRWVPTLKQKREMLESFAKELDVELTQNLPTKVGSVIKYPDGTMWMLIMSDDAWGVRKWTSGRLTVEPRDLPEGWELVGND